jgi:hypothetical protein
MSIWDDVKDVADGVDKAYNPMRKVADAITTATPQPTEAQTARQEAVAAGNAARQEAVDRGKGLETKTVGEDVKKESFP